MKTLLFTIATNGYAGLYRVCIQSQKQYATRNGYDYVVVNRPQWILRHSGSDSAWLKVPLILGGFNNGYDVVAFIDADCQILGKCPPLYTLFKASALIYVAHGFSGRINSGFIVSRNDEGSHRFFSDLLASAYSYSLPAEDIAPYENGYFINKGKNSPIVHILDSCWNNNHVPKSTDFVRHYTGPMRALFEHKLAPRLGVIAISLISVVLRGILPGKKTFHKRIEAHFRMILRSFPEYFSDYGIANDLTPDRMHSPLTSSTTR